jgi:hypothetical protein
VLDCPNTVAVLTWNLSDRYCDPPDEVPLRKIGWRYRKTLYDMQMQRKSLWDALAQSFAGRRL